ncbi:sigma-70 family RNA polymerase sigma factor [Anaerosalibacter massiliensis]|uniref:Sigma-70 family RNA polymerase sigma factor n=1 Tax=Anaerosalibacter massiliensis TaxID=1347392 RepID=A0A9X2ML56_9FIRM|nr:sigma-70 family RNA polymerase sigma factor [Anaerosalibacter massiliensis]MCR2045506.1 sigma-70 family RNA polymerase sigma factor [Anaerosalibacter massiliensis]
MNEEINKMVEENLNLVPFVVYKKFKVDISKNPDLIDEYIGVGNEALIEACQRFDESHGVKFSTYAVSIIWGKIQRFRRDKKNSIRLPRRLQKAGTEYNRGKALNKDIDTICKETGVKKEDIEEWLRSKGVVNLDTPIRDPKDEGSNTTMLDMLTDDFDVEESVVEDIKYKEKMEILEKALRPLEFQVVKLVESGIYKQNDLANILGVSQPQVSRILKRLTKLVGPTLEKYYSGEIDLQEFCKRLKIKEDVFMNFDKEIKIACNWLINNPGEELNLAKVLKEEGINISSYYRTRLKGMILKEMLKEGYQVEEVPYASGGTRLKLCESKEIRENQEKEKIIIEEKEEENVLLNILDIPISNCDLEFTEALQKSLSMFTMLGKTTVLDIRVREVSQ